MTPVRSGSAQQVWSRPPAAGRNYWNARRPASLMLENPLQFVRILIATNERLIG